MIVMAMVGSRNGTKMTGALTGGTKKNGVMMDGTTRLIDTMIGPRGPIAGWMGIGRRRVIIDGNQGENTGRAKTHMTMMMIIVAIILVMNREKRSSRNRHCIASLSKLKMKQKRGKTRG